MVEKDLRVKGYNNVFAIGDITDIPVSLRFELIVLLFATVVFFILIPLVFGPA
jgi:hypothetical protein